MDITIHHEDELRFRARSGKHEVVFDLPVPHGGTDQGMSPPQLFVASLGACIGVYVADYCDTAGLDYRGMKIHLDWAMREDPRRIGRIEFRIDLPFASLSATREKAILNVARRCLLHNTLVQQPEMNVQLHRPAETLAAGSLA